MDGTIVGQGSFTQGATAMSQTLVIPSGVDWLWVYNFTQSDAAAGNGYMYYWQRGMGTIGLVHAAGALGAVTVAQTAANAFVLYDPTLQTLGAASALTAITAANPPVVTTAATLPSVCDVVRFSSLDNQPQIAGIDFTVTAAGGGTFTIGNINLTNSVASTAGFWRLVNFDPIFYPRNRTITYISTAVQPKVYLSVTHGFTVGQKVRLSFPGGSAVWENFAALDGLTATIIAVNVARAGNEPNNGGTANNIQIDLDTSTFGNWNVFGAGGNQAYPPATAVPFSPAQVVPVGEDTGFALTSVLAQTPLDCFGNQIVNTNTGILADSTVNTAFLGMRIAAGALLPAGTANDVVFWRAGKSTYGGL